jgi:8-oxo-dGTP diphosphatase
MRVGFDCVGVGIGAAIVNPDGKLFLALRSQGAKNERGLWETPGGGAEFGETMEQTIIREMKEEYGFVVQPIQQLHTYDHILKTENQHWIAVTFLCKIKSGKPKIKEPHKCDGIGWYSLAEAKKLPLTHTAKKDIAELKRIYPTGIPNFYD